MMRPRVANGALVEIRIGRHRFVARVLSARRHIKDRHGQLYSPDYVLVRRFDPERGHFCPPVSYLRRRIVCTFPRFKHGWNPIPKVPIHKDVDNHRQRC